MKHRARIYEGKTKILYEGPQPYTNILFFKDDIGTINIANNEKLEGKGLLNNRISEHILLLLQKSGIPTHFIKRLNLREQLVKSVEMIPIKVVVRNIAAGSIARRFNLKVGSALPQTIIEFYYKDLKLNYPLVSEEHITAFGWANSGELDDILQYSVRVNDFLNGFFASMNLSLVDLKLEFGRFSYDNLLQIILADELSPENIRLYDEKKHTLYSIGRETSHASNLVYYKMISEKLGIIQEVTNNKKFTPHIVS